MYNDGLLFGFFTFFSFCSLTQREHDADNGERARHDIEKVELYSHTAVICYYKNFYHHYTPFFDSGLTSSMFIHIYDMMKANRYAHKIGFFEILKVKSRKNCASLKDIPSSTPDMGIHTRALLLCPLCGPQKALTGFFKHATQTVKAPLFPAGKRDTQIYEAVRA